MAEKLDLLFDTIRPPEHKDRKYSPNAVAAKINERAGKEIITGVYIWQLRTGRAKNPTLVKLRALASFFGVPVAYLVDDGEEADLVHRDLSALRGMLRLEVRGLAARLANLPGPGLDYVRDIIIQVDHAYELQRQQQHHDDTSAESEEGKRLE